MFQHAAESVSDGLRLTSRRSVDSRAMTQLRLILDLEWARAVTASSVLEGQYANYAASALS